MPPPGLMTRTVAVTEPGWPLADGEAVDVSLVAVLSALICWLSDAEVVAR